MDCSCDDWGVDSCIFHVVDASWGAHSVDCFVLSYNTPLFSFHSRFWSPGCEVVDTFTVSRGNELNWWIPLLHLICRTIRHAAQCRVKSTLIIPAWKSAPF